MPWERHIIISNEWQILFANAHYWLRQKQGTKAQFEYSQQSAQTFMIVPFLCNISAPLSIRFRGPRKAAYECHGDGTLPDLSEFRDIEFFVIPDDLAWTMIHTHEDYGFGGPYFVHRDWQGTPGAPNRSCH